jgi:hypothetical protein
MVRVIHNKCGKIAFYFKKRLKEGETIHADNVVHIDGSQAIPGEPMYCESCGDLIRPNPYTVTIEQEDWTDWFINDEIRNKNLEVLVVKPLP